MSKTVEELIGSQSASAVHLALQGTLYDLSALARITKQAHWNVKGPHFRPIHEHLDEIYAAVDAAVDEVAERLAALGASPSGQSREVSENTRLEPLPLGFIRDRQVVELMTDRLGMAVQTTRERMATIEEPDPVTADLFHGILETLEKHLWMLRSQME